jgi:hypothetical protein
VIVPKKPFLNELVYKHALVEDRMNPKKEVYTSYKDLSGIITDYDNAHNSNSELLFSKTLNTSKIMG